MDTQDVQHGAQILIQFSSQARTDIQALLGRVRGIAWAGPGREAFVDDVERLAQALARQLELGEELGQRLQREAEEWEQGGQGLASGWAPGPEIGLIGVAPGFISDVRHEIGRSIRDIWAVVDPYELKEVAERLEQTPAGKQLIDQARQAGLCFILPDGTRLGDPDGRPVNVSFSKTGHGGYFTTDLDDGGPARDDWGIVLNDSFLSRRLGINELADTLGHEMQHAVNQQAGIDGFVPTPTNGATDYQTLLQSAVERRVADEVSAYNRGNAILTGGNYTDDGVLTADEVRNILEKKDYASIYEEQYADYCKDKGYTIDVWVDKDGKPRVTLTKISPPPTPVPVGTPAPVQA
jgi:uncharacterized protein YukE